MLIFIQEIGLQLFLWLLQLVDGLMEIFSAISGVATVNYHGQQVNIIEFIVGDSTIGAVFWCIFITAVGLTCIFTIVGLVKNMIANNRNVSTIVGKFFLALLGTMAIEKQMETIRGEIDGNIELLERTEGDKGRIEKIIERQTNELAVLREQLKLVQAKIESNQSVNTELERIKKLLTDDSLNFDVYDDRSVRLLIEYIRVMEDGKIVIMLKGGITIEERVE